MAIDKRLDYGDDFPGNYWSDRFDKEFCCDEGCHYCHWLGYVYLRIKAGDKPASTANNQSQATTQT